MPLIPVALALVLSAAPGDGTVVLKAARMFDARKGVMVTPGLVVVDSSGRIASVGGSAPANAEVIDLGDATLLPGFMDAHTHLAMQSSGNWKDDWVESLRETIPEETLHASVYARATLLAGFTTVRNLGARDFIDEGLREAIKKGYVAGPNMLVSLDALSTTGGHCDSSGTREGLFAEDAAAGVADGADALRAKVRRNLKFGADVIKVCATGGVLSMADDVQRPQVTQAEMDAIVDEAHTRGLKVAVHAHGAEGAKRAIRAGADSIEHGTFLDDEALNMMKRKGTWLVPTLVAFQGVKKRLEANGLPPPVVPKAKAALASAGQVIRKAIQLKLKIALGTDAGVYPHGENAGELPLLVDAGMTPAQALQTATIRTAELLGVDDHAGVLEAGKAADIIAVPGDPTDDIEVVKDVRLVMKGGVIFKRDGAPTPQPAAGVAAAPAPTPASSSSASSSSSAAASALPPTPPVLSGDGASKPVVLDEQRAQDLFELAVNQFRDKKPADGCSTLALIAKGAASTSLWREKARNLSERRCR